MRAFSRLCGCFQVQGGRGVRRSSDAVEIAVHEPPGASVDRAARLDASHCCRAGSEAAVPQVTTDRQCRLASQCFSESQR
jgi:hypothetical protein